ncbi:MAG: hypothetical protein EXX96DRAFT_591582 [Benjaminiella poitrasii]|nr:MAG: hypothetical protein EXX96DRAFT_591582 [Benjaminiella poitrasii]
MKTRNSSKKETPMSQDNAQKRRSTTSSIKRKNNKKPKLDSDPFVQSNTINEDLANEDNDTNKKGKEKLIYTEDQSDSNMTHTDNNKLDDDGDNSDDDDDIDWETIPLLSPRCEDQDTAVEPTYNDVEIVMQTPRPILKKSHWERAYQRILHEWMHHSHVVLLIAHYKLRNKWCLNTELQTICYSIIPENVKRMISKDLSKKSLTISIRMLLKWWNNDIFKLTGPGLLTKSYGHYCNKEFEDWINNNKSDKDGDHIKDLNAFKELIRLQKPLLGTRDTSAELFVTILRCCGYDARLVCSLQPISYKVPMSNDNQSINTSITNDNDTVNPPLFEFRVRTKAYVDPDAKLKNPTKGKPPTVWAEVYCSDTKRWMCVDPIRGHIDKPSLMEPSVSDQDNKLSFILAFDNKGYVTDVTRRYTCNMERVVRLRERPLTKRELNGGMKLWSERFLSTLCHKPKFIERDRIELEELGNQEMKEVMPTSIGGFKNHSLFVLERHLLKFEVIYPKNPVLGAIRGEKIYPRSCVKSVKTAEQYYKQGKKIIEGEQPIKMVKTNAVTLEKKRLKELAKQEGEDLMVACYGEWQTEPYIPPPVVDGVLPKNRFGNIDLFTPSMLPKGAAHLAIKGIEKIAKKLSVDYAVAVVDFDFVKMRAVPVTNGIIVAEEQQWILIEAWEEYEQNEAIKAVEKQKKDVIIRWRKLIKSILINERLSN